MNDTIPKVSLWRSLIFNLFHVVPYYLQGIFKRNRFWVSVFSSVHPDPMGIGFVEKVRRSFPDTPYFYLYMLNRKTLWVLDEDHIRRVLDLSPEIYAEPGMKRTGMSHFQPGAATISRGDDWKDRRRFNEAALQSGRPPRYGDQLLPAIADAFADWPGARKQELCWTDFVALLEDAAMQILVGRGTSEHETSQELSEMMRESNRVFALRESAYFDSYYHRIKTWLRYPSPDSLMARAAQAPATERTSPDTQVTHWLFALKDTLPENIVRTMALLAAHPDAMRQARAEIDAMPAMDAASIDQMPFLEGCIQEAMRLWPTTPLLMRESLTAYPLGEHMVPAGMNVLISNNFNHRDRQSLNHADRFNPEFWQHDPVDYRLNHLSNGTQACAGKHLALFVAKALLVHLFQDTHYHLAKPHLDASGPLPHRFNQFAISLIRETA